MGHPLVSIYTKMQLIIWSKQDTPADAVDLQFFVCAEADGDLLVVRCVLGDELRHSARPQLTGGHPRGQRLLGQRDHRRARPQDVHAGRVPVAQRRVQAHVRQLTPEEEEEQRRGWDDRLGLVRQQMRTTSLWLNW